MSMFFAAVLVLYFVSFYLFGGLAARGFTARRFQDVRGAAQKIPAGLTSMGERFVTPTAHGRLRRRLLEAGQPRDMDVNDLIALKLLGSIVGIVAAAAAGVTLGFDAARILTLALILAGTGFFAPDAWLSRLIEMRKKEISRSLPDILDMLTISVEAGLGFDSAVSKVVKNFKGSLAQEFFRWLREVQLGRSRKEAWKDLTERINVPDVNSFVLAILQADVFGVSIGKVLRVQSEEMRVKRRQRAEEIAMKTPVKVVFPLVLCIFPALIIVILGPAGIKIVQAFQF